MGRGVSEEHVDIMITTPQSTGQVISAYKDALSAVRDGDLTSAFQAVDIVQQTMSVWLNSVVYELGWGVDDISQMLQYVTNNL